MRAKTTFAIIAAAVIAVAAGLSDASARGGGGRGGGGGGGGGGHGAHAGGGGSGSGGRSFHGGSRGGGGAGLSRGGGRSQIGARSFGGSRHIGRSFTRSGRSFTRSSPRVTRSSVSRRMIRSGPRLSAGRINRTGAGNGFDARHRSAALGGARLRAAHLARAHAALGYRAISNSALRSSIGGHRFHGRFHGSHRPWWRGGLVIGWIGPAFWPYAYDDFFDYVFWPYAYDDFWPYAYDDVYYGIYGVYAEPRVGYAEPRAGAPQRRPRAGAPDRRAAGICNEQAPALTDWPIERISQVVEPTDAQRALLDELKSATAKAVDLLKSACPKDLPSIPTGRLAAMESRLQVMLAAVQAVRPALEQFYQSLSDEQKARFNAVALGENAAAAGRDRRYLTQLCGERAPGIADLPIDRISQLVHPTAEQQAALDELKQASAQAAEALKADCPTYQALTPTGRVEAMEKRLEVMLTAVRTVQPALAKFYDALSDEQKARFNTIRSASR